MAVAVPRWFMDLATGIDPGLAAVLAALAQYESNFDPNAVGDGGTSFGLLQFHQGGGLGDGHSQADLLNPEYNLRLGASYIRGRLNQGATLWDALQPWSVRPSAWALLERMKAEGIEGYGVAFQPSIPDLTGKGDDGGPPVNAGGWLLALLAIVVLDQIT